MFTNRNPRNLEQMRIAKRDKGWAYNHPTHHYHHRLRFEQTQMNIRAWVEHSSGMVVVEASTIELAIRRHLYSTTDRAAALNIGRVVAARCAEAGITAALPAPVDLDDTSLKYKVFLEAVQAGGLALAEPDEVEPRYEPGLDYSSPEAMADLQRRQRAVNEPAPVRFGTKDSNWL